MVLSRERHELARWLPAVLGSRPGRSHRDVCGATITSPVYSHFVHKRVWFVLLVEYWGLNPGPSRWTISPAIFIFRFESGSCWVSKLHGLGSNSPSSYLGLPSHWDYMCLLPPRLCFVWLEVTKRFSHEYNPRRATTNDSLENYIFWTQSHESGNQWQRPLKDPA